MCVVDAVRLISARALLHEAAGVGNYDPESWIPIGPYSVSLGQV